MNDLMRVPPEELRAAGSDLIQLSAAASRVQSTVRQQWGRLDHGWQSYARAGVEEQYAETLREIERMALMLQQLGEALAKTANIIEAADQEAVAFFHLDEAQSGTGKPPSIVVPPPAEAPPGDAQTPLPDNMQELAQRIMDLPEDRPIEIIEIAPGEYLVLFRGTASTQDVPHNWGAAALSGMGLPGDYELQARDLILATVPAGSVLHFAGHSQGGIVAANLADNQDFVDQYSLKNVIMFGAPQSSVKNPDVDYYRYAALGDPTPALSRFALVTGDLSAMIFTAGVAALSQTLTYSGEYDPYDIRIAHASYGGAPELAATPLPFTITQGGQTYALQPPTTSIGYGFDQLLYGDSSWDRLGGGVNLLWGTGVSLTLSIIDTFSENWTYPLPESVRDGVDRYLDRTYEAVTELPMPTEVAEAAVNYVVDVANSDNLGDVADATVDVLGAAWNETQQFFATILYGK
ncbi:MAG TPA: WXG100 family type VII secretion target [Anaerolineae bacterium]|nr:WXG100 family type VII secretion target [Anaerolineae bacterium]